MKLIGLETVHPILFYSGKIAGYSTWIVYLLIILNAARPGGPPFPFVRVSALVLTGLGLVVTAVSLINLGNSTRLGLPREVTEFKTGGLYRFSRNPMYLGFNLLTLASMARAWSPVVAVLGTFSIITYHFIILGEERFLGERFGEKYRRYKERTRRYL
jgi:protein-S-isoprenylcysteine O-methyltransferase Ste14